MDILFLMPRLKKRVKDKVRECLNVAQIHFQTDFDMPEIRYDIHDTDSGRAIPSQWVLRFNPIFLIQNEEDFIASTVPHEVAHLVNDRVNIPPNKKQLRPHGKGWVTVMSLFGVEPEVTHSYDCTSILESTITVRGPHGYAAQQKRNKERSGPGLSRAGGSNGA